MNTKKFFRSLLLPALAVAISLGIFYWYTAGVKPNKPNEPITFFQQAGAAPEDIQKIEMRLRWKESERSVLLPGESAWGQRLIEYLDCQVEEVSMPEGAYELDPLLLVIETAEGRKEIQLITTEGDEGEGGSTLHWAEGERVYRLQNREQEAALGETIPGSCDPLFHFFIMAYIQRDAERQGDTGTPFPRYLNTQKVYDENRKSCEELSEAASLVLMGRIESIIRHEESESRLKVRVQEVWKGETAEAKEFVYLQKIDGLSQDRFFHIGVSEQCPEEGQTYLFFLQEGADGQYELVDERFGMLEVTAGDWVRPIFSVDLDWIEEYYQPLNNIHKNM